VSATADPVVGWQARLLAAAQDNDERALSEVPAVNSAMPLVFPQWTIALATLLVL
jgi:hypothetical protein